MSEPRLAGQFFDDAIELLRRVRDEEAGNISKAGAMVAETVADGGRLFAFGAGHSSLPAQDIVYRAGGFALMNLLAVPGTVGVDVVPATLGSVLERVDGLARAVLETSPAQSGDLLTARSLGLKVIGVTSVAYAEGTRSRHVSGSFLKDHCDLALDSKIPVGDAELTAEGIDAPFAPASTVVTSALVQAVMATAAGELVHRGITPPLLRSGNVDGGREWNDRVLSEYAARIFFRH
jgi:uncharacterized phosphosugar-binding protein